MIRNSWFDDQVRKKLADYEPEVPSHIWENISSKDKKRRPVFWLWPSKGIGILLITLFLGGSGYLISKSIFIKPNEKADGNNITPNSMMVTENRSNVIQKEERDNNIQPQANEKKEDPNHLLPTKTVLKEDANGSEISASSSHYTSHRTAGMSRTSTYGSLPEDSYTKSNENISTTDSDFYILQRDFQAYARKPTLQSSPSIRPLNHPELNVPCPEEDAAGNKKYFEIYGGPDLVFRSFTDTGNSAYRTKRKETTDVTFAFSTGARFTRVFNNGMSLRTGINYSQINEKFTIVEGSIVHSVFILTPAGDTIGNYSTIGTQYRTRHNKYHSLDIPLQAGYELGNGRFHANLNAGVIVNVYSWQKGEVIDTANKAVSINTGSPYSPYKFKTNIGVGFLAGVSMYYKLDDRFHLLAEPYFRYNLSALNNEGLTLKQKFNNAGMRFGIRYDLK